MSLLIDASSPAIVNAASATTTLSTGSFTPPSGALLVAVAMFSDGASDIGNTGVLSDSVGGTWTARVSEANYGAFSGQVFIATSPVSSSSARTVTATFGGLSGSSTAKMLAVYVMTGADTTTFGTTQGATWVHPSLTWTTSFTTTLAGSMVIGGIADDNGAGTLTVALASNTAFAPMTGSNPIATNFRTLAALKSSGLTGTPGALTYGLTASGNSNSNTAAGAFIEILPSTNSTISANDNTNPTADTAVVHATVPATTNTGTFTDTATVSVPLPVNDPATGTDVATVRVFAGDTGAGDEANTLLAGGATLKFGSDAAVSAEATAPLVIKDGDTGSVADSLQTATLGIQGKLPPGPRIVRVGGS